MRGVEGKVVPGKLLGFDNFVKDAAEFFDGVGLLDNAGKSVFAVFRHDRVITITAGDDGANVGILQTELLESFASAHPAGDGEIHNHSSEWFAGTLGLAVANDCFGAVLHSFGSVAEMMKHRADEIANWLFIVHDEDAPGAFEICRCVGLLDWNLVGGSGQIEMENGAVTVSGFNGENAFVAFDDRECRGQAEASAAALGGEVRIENFRQQVGGNARAFVAHGNAHVIARGQGNFGAGNQGMIFGRDADGSALRHRLDGIENEIVNDLVNLAGIDFGRGEVFVDVVLSAES